MYRAGRERDVLGSQWNVFRCCRSGRNLRHGRKPYRGRARREELGTYLEPFELYKLLAYDELNGNVSIRDSPLYYFQTLGYENAREKLSQYNGCIISDSVGLGKSFICGELLYDHRQQSKRCLLIVPANLTDQWRDLLQDATDEDGEKYFGLEVDSEHLDVMSISKFQNLTYDEVQELDDRTVTWPFRHTPAEMFPR